MYKTKSTECTQTALSHTSVLVVIRVITELCVVEMRGGGGVTGDPPQCLMLVSHNGNLLITVRNTINRIKNTV